MGGDTCEAVMKWLRKVGYSITYNLGRRGQSQYGCEITVNLKASTN